MRDLIRSGNDAFGQKAVAASLSGATGDALGISLGDIFSTAIAVPEPMLSSASGVGTFLMRNLVRRRLQSRDAAKPHSCQTDA